MTALLDDLLSTLSSNLVRRASDRCSDWAQNYVVLGKPVPGAMRFDRFPWTEAWCNDDSSWAGMKAAQMGMTNAALIRAIYTVDIKRNDVLYVLPKKNPDAADFSKAKFDGLLDQSEHLKSLFSNTRNIGHKQAGSTNLFIRGARSRSGLKSISTGLIIFDELDEMPQKNISLAEERGSGYSEEDRQDIRISTPVVPEFGIHIEFKNGNQQHFCFKCLACNRWTELLPFESLKIIGDGPNDPRIKESYVFCKECKVKIVHKQKPEWFKTHEWVKTENHDAPTNSYWIPQLYSTTLPPWKIAKSILKAEVDPAEEQELFNSKFGWPHVVKGAQVTDDDINACQQKGGGYQIPFPPAPLGIVTLGIDVGSVLHFEVNQWFLPAVIGKDLNTYAIPKVIEQGTRKHFYQLDELMVQYNVSHAVIDHEPENRSSLQFADRFPGRVHLAYPHRGMSERQLTIKAETNSVGFRRTSWLDLSQGRFKRQAILLPSNITLEYREAVKALIRVEKKNDFGDLIARYVSTKPDHEAFSRLYSEIALVFAVAGRENQDIGYYL